MPKDYVTILRTILKEYALTKTISSKWLFDLINIQTILTFQDLIDVMDELLEETANNTKVIFDLLID